MVLLQEGLLLPSTVGEESARFAPDWRVLATDGFRLDEQLRREGWASFFIAGELSGMALGWSQAAAKNAALRLLRKVRALDFNCAELGKVSHARFFGVPYVHVTGHARHIQAGFQLHGFAARKRQQTQSDWARN